MKCIAKIQKHLRVLEDLRFVQSVLRMVQAHLLLELCGEVADTVEGKGCRRMRHLIRGSRDTSCLGLNFLGLEKF